MSRRKDPALVLLDKLDHNTRYLPPILGKPLVLGSFVMVVFLTLIFILLCPPARRPQWLRDTLRQTDDRPTLAM